LAASWDAQVSAADLVLVPGDISWAMRLHEAAGDLAWLAARPGRKVLIRGNHDYWWQSLKKVREALDASCSALQNDVFVSDDLRIAVAGARLWTVPGIAYGDILEPAPEPTAATPAPARERDIVDDEKIFARELARLALSLAKLPDDAEHRIAMLHFPPTGPDLHSTRVTDLIEAHRVHLCVFGHLHHVRQDARFEGTLNGVQYRLVSCDYLGFAPVSLF